MHLKLNKDFRDWGSYSVGHKSQLELKSEIGFYRKAGGKVYKFLAAGHSIWFNLEDLFKDPLNPTLEEVEMAKMLEPEFAQLITFIYL